EMSVITRSTVSMVLPQLEFDLDLDHDVDDLTQSCRGCESPLAHGRNRPLVQPMRESVQQFDVADRTVAAHDNLENHCTLDVGSPRLLGVAGLYFAKDSRGQNAASRTIRASARAAACSVADTRPIALPQAGPRPCAHAA